MSAPAEQRPHVLRSWLVLLVASIAGAGWFVYGARPVDPAIGAKPGFTAPARHDAKPSPAAETAFYRRAAERTARLTGKPAPRWKACASCALAFHGRDTVPENPATGHAPGDWQP